MQTIQALQPGGPDVLQVQDAPLPEPGAGQVRIRVESASVNFSDVMRRRGDPYPIPTHFPYTPGSEIAGVVDDVGDGADRALRGQAVFALAGTDGSGGYAQYALASAAGVSPIPSGLSPDVACAIVVAGVTPMLMLTQAVTVKPGDTVLVQGAGGALGGYAVQIAKSLGARVIATGSTSAKRERALRLGADHVIDVTQAAWEHAVMDASDGRGVDVALEGGGAETFRQTLACLAPFGSLVVYGFAGGSPLVFSHDVVERFFYTPAPNQTLRAFNLAGYAFGRRDLFGTALGRLIELIADGRIRIDIETAPLADAATIHRRLEQRDSVGKIVLKPW